MGSHDRQTSELLRRAGRGDDAAVQRLFQIYRQRLKRMILVHLGRRLAVRVDPSDIVQEALADAARRLPDYLSKRPIPFYPWLRRMALQKLLDLRRQHVEAHKRSVYREEALDGVLPDESLAALADHFVAPGTQPSERAVREELRHRVRMTLGQLSGKDREVLVLRYLEQLSPKEGAAALGISESSFMKRHLRAIQRLRRLLDGQVGDSR